ncbi:hypothetical protein GOP47_0008261 [Adiantum capillus-veneris]|uniref:AB hydrolase-1 domain-containing protein n=1 Tax=Adiantum capillus-veneris TaxID=13818 RepID=A0A9D4ZK99_ADICA|nr:hypothetical protein GOP47_0008261 [Adiantum capillus-veneris]
MAHTHRSLQFIKFGRLYSSLAFETVRAGEDRQQVRRGIVIHGLMGAAKNLRPLCTRLLKEVLQQSPFNAPGWELALVDLRNHGKSAGMEHLRSPHNIQSAAKDIANLIKLEEWNWPDIVIGHSFGGKVALEFGESCAYGRYGSTAVAPKQLWVLDSIPAKVDMEEVKETHRILTTIRGLPQPIPSHRWLLEKIMEEGFSRSLAIWIGRNLKRVEPSSEKMTWIFDVEAINDMLLSYRQTSYWSFLEAPPQGTNIGMVRAENSDRWSPSVILRLEKLVEANQQESKEQGTLHYHILKNSGHWVHVDNPSGLIDIITPSFLNLATHSF